MVHKNLKILHTNLKHLSSFFKSDEKCGTSSSADWQKLVSITEQIYASSKIPFFCPINGHCVTVHFPCSGHSITSWSLGGSQIGNAAIDWSLGPLQLKKHLNNLKVCLIKVNGVSQGVHSNEWLTMWSMIMLSPLERELYVGGEVVRQYHLCYVLFSLFF